MTKSAHGTPSWITVNLIVCSLMASTAVTFWLVHRFGAVDYWERSAWLIAAYGFLPALSLLTLMVTGTYPAGWLRSGHALQRAMGCAALLAVSWLIFLLLKWSAVVDWREGLDDTKVLFSLVAATMLIPAVALARRGLARPDAATDHAGGIKSPQVVTT